MHTLYTLGYQGCRPADVTAYIREFGALLADIRYRPWSPNPTWQPGGLVALVGSAHYCGLPMLGNRNYNSDGPITLANPAAAVAIVERELGRRPVILLCACAQVSTCHRRDAADYLALHLGCTIEHLPGHYDRWREGQAVA